MKLPANQRVPPIDTALAATAQSTPEAQVVPLLDRIYASTKIGDAATEEKMFGETTAQLTARNDSMMAFAASLRPFADQLLQEKAARDGAMSRLRPVMLDALRVANAGRLYPDANGTLRVGFGRYRVTRAQRGLVSAADRRPRRRPEESVSSRSAAEASARARREAEFGTYIDEELKWCRCLHQHHVVTNGSSGSVTMNAWGSCAVSHTTRTGKASARLHGRRGLTRTIPATRATCSGSWTPSTERQPAARDGHHPHCAVRR